MTYGEYFGKLAYEAYCKHASEIDEEGLAGHATAWAELDQGMRDCWAAAGQAIRVDIGDSQIGNFGVDK